MDGHPNKKRKQHKGIFYSDNRYAIVKWLEQEMPQISGRVINIGAGGWKVPHQLLNHSKITEYKTFDKKLYGDNKNKVDVYGDIQNMPSEWGDYWDAVICVEVIECVPNLFKAFEEMFRILKPGGVLYLTAPFNYRAFGDGTWGDKKKDKRGIKDYWRITKQGLQLLGEPFSEVKVRGYGGTGPHDRYGHWMRAIK